MDIENNDFDRGAQVKTGDKFGIPGWWVCKDLTETLNPVEIGDPDDIVTGGPGRLIYIYFGKRKPSKEEMEALINNANFY